VLFLLALSPHALWTVYRGGDHFEFRPLDLYWVPLSLAAVEGATIGAWELSADPRRNLAATIAARADEVAGILAK